MPPNRKFSLDIPIADDSVEPDENESTRTSAQEDVSPTPLAALEAQDEDSPHGDDGEGNGQQQGTEKPEQSQPGHHHEDHHHLKIIKHLASFVEDADELNIDEQRLARAVRDAGEFSYGVVACEVWTLEEDKLVRPKGGCWCNWKLYPQLSQYEAETPEPIMPGVDIPGILWSETEQHHSLFQLNNGDDSRPGSGRNTPARHPSNEGLGDLAHFHLHHGSHNHHPHIVWRDLHTLAKDPDSAKTERLYEAIRAGLGAAAGVPFHVRDHRGIVVYYAVSTPQQTDLHETVANSAYLKASAELIGHAAALSEIRRASVENKRRRRMEAAEKFKRNILGSTKTDVELPRLHTAHDGVDGCNGKAPCTDDFEPTSKGITESFLHKLRTWCHKCRGGNLQVPPSMSTRQSLLTIFGVFCSLLILSSLNQYYQMVSDHEYLLVIGPFGALMTLQYGLTAAPASQPRNAILGQAIAGAISLAFTYIPESMLATWLRRAISPAFSIGTMCWLGIPHPPAGAHALIYASGDYNFGFYALVLLSTVISIIPATLINNMSSKRQYPSYWSFIKLPEFAPRMETKVKRTNSYQSA